MVRVFNPKTWFSAAPQGNKDENLVFQTKFYVEDASCVGKNHVTSLLLYTHAGYGEDFFQGIKPEEVVSGKKVKAVHEIVDKLTKFNVWAEAAVEKTPSGHLLLKDTIVKKF